jgi:hypothetical protein
MLAALLLLLVVVSSEGVSVAITTVDIECERRCVMDESRMCI